MPSEVRAYDHNCQRVRVGDKVTGSLEVAYTVRGIFERDGEVCVDFGDNLYGWARLYVKVA